MQVEYFADVEPKLLLTWGDDPGDATTLRRAAQELAAHDVGYPVVVDQLPGFHGVDRCTLTAVTGNADRGLEPVGGSGQRFRCTLRPMSWETVSEMLEPFERERPEPRRETFQYLDENGPVLWIVSTDRAW